MVKFKVVTNTEDESKSARHLLIKEMKNQYTVGNPPSNNAFIISMVGSVDVTDGRHEFEVELHERVEAT